MIVIPIIAVAALAGVIGIALSRALRSHVAGQALRCPDRAMRDELVGIMIARRFSENEMRGLLHDPFDEAA